MADSAGKEELAYCVFCYLWRVFSVVSSNFAVLVFKATVEHFLNYRLTSSAAGLI